MILVILHYKKFNLYGTNLEKDAKNTTNLGNKLVLMSLCVNFKEDMSADSTCQANQLDTGSRSMGWQTLRTVICGIMSCTWGRNTSRTPLIRLH